MPSVVRFTTISSGSSSSSSSSAMGCLRLCVSLQVSLDVRCDGCCDGVCMVMVRMAAALCRGHVLDSLDAGGLNSLCSMARTDLTSGECSYRRQLSQLVSSIHLRGPKSLQQCDKLVTYQATACSVVSMQDCHLSAIASYKLTHPGKCFWLADWVLR